MKLLELKINNFRQFYGDDYRIIFSSDIEKNITVIHGNNGSGKTALLNAITWVLYEAFTNAFQAPNELVNKRAINEAMEGDTISCFVELLFEHNEKKYRIKRHKNVIKVNQNNNDTKDNSENRADLQWVDEHGRWKKEEAVNDIIGRIFPEQLHRYFFLDGERIEALQKPEKEGEVFAATKLFIGEEVLIRAERHLGGYNGAKQKFEEELKKIGDAETNQLIEEKNELEVELEQAKADDEQHKINLIGLNKEKDDIENDLRAKKNVQGLQERRVELEQQLKEIKTNDLKAANSLAEIISTRTYQVFLKEPVKIFRDIIEQLRNKGELPASIKKPFVEDLLNKQKCICKRSLTPGKEPFDSVKEWLEIFGLSDIEEVAIKMGAEVDVLERDIPKVFEQINIEQKHRKKYKEQVSTIINELESISETLKSSNEDEVRSLEIRYEEVKNDINVELRAKYLNEEAIKDIESKVEGFNKEIKRRENINEEHDLANTRLAATLDAAKIIEEVRRRLKEYSRVDLDKRIKQIFTNISFKPYVPILDENYSLYLMDKDTGRVGASTGENQILSLSFIGAIIEQAKIYTSKKDKLPSPDSSEFPIVLDSPFGNLDPIHRRQVAISIPELANQVILFLTKTQWEGEVEQSTVNKIGKEYVLEYNSPKEDVEEAILIRKGKTYQLVKKSHDDFEAVEIVEVS